MLTIHTDAKDIYQITLNTFPVDGFQLSLSIWDGEEFLELSDLRYIFYTPWEAGMKALGQAGVEYMNRYRIMTEMGFEETYPEEEEE